MEESKWISVEERLPERWTGLHDVANLRREVFAKTDYSGRSMPEDLTYGANT